jgi:general stress protein 26
MNNQKNLNVLYDWLFFYDPNDNLWVAMLKDDYDKGFDDPDFVAPTLFATSIDAVVNHITNNINPIN